MARAKKPQDEPALRFEEALERLETLVEELDSEELALEDLVKHYAEGVRLLKACQNELENARQQIETIRTEAAPEPSGGDVSTGSEGESPGESAAGGDDEIRLF